MTGLAGGFAADGANSWVADLLFTARPPLDGIAYAILGWEGSSVPAPAAIAVSTSARKAPTLRALVQTRPSLFGVSVLRAWRRNARVWGGCVDGGRAQHVGLMGMPMWPTPAAVQAVDFVVLAWPTPDAVAPPCNDQEAVRQPGGPHQRPTSVNLAGSTRPADALRRRLYRRRVALAKTVSKVHRPRTLPGLRMRMSPPLNRPHRIPARGLPRTCRMGEAGLSRRPRLIGAGAAGCPRTVDSPPPTVGAPGWP